MEANSANEQKETVIEGLQSYRDLVLPDLLMEKFTDFVRHTPVKQFGRNLRSLILEFATTRNAVGLPLYWEDLFLDLESFYILLDEIEDYPQAAAQKTRKGALIRKSLKEAFIKFVSHTQAKQFGRNLRNMILDFAADDDAGTAPYWKDLSLGLQNLFRLLDAIEDEAGALQEGKEAV